MRNKNRNKIKGFTLIEVIVGMTVFAIIVTGVIGVYSALTKTVKVAREKTILSSLATHYLEIVRNLPYDDVGTASGNPTGTLPDAVGPFTQTIEAVQYRIYYEVTYIDDPADGTIVLGTDSAPNDYKQVKMTVLNTVTNKTTTFSTNVAPEGLEGLSNAGALSILVFDASGQPVANANIHIEYPPTSPTIVLDRQTDSLGKWIEVGLPAAPNSYRITVTKAGYSTDRTYPSTVANPNPVKPDATIVNGVVTQVSFSIDLLSSLTVRTWDQTCQPINGVNVNIRGAKLIGTSPDVLKYDNSFTSSAGQIALTNLEWDTYTPTLLTGQPWIVFGTSPIQQINVLPGSSQIYTIILGTSTTANSLLVIVKDAATGTAIEGATVHLRKGGSTPQDYYGTTGGSVWKQADWTGGSGQIAFTNSDQYFIDDGNVDINSVPTGLRLRKSSGDYVPSGYLESSTFDTGAVSNFSSITWEPTSQNPGTTLEFQIASNNDNATWNYKGPDGTAATYYTVSGSQIHASHDGDRYVRYKAFLSTTNDKKTPILTSIHINYVSGCFTPGQVAFPDLTAGNNYDLDVSLTGYQTTTVNSMSISGNQTIEILLSP